MDNNDLEILPPGIPADGDLLLEHRDDDEEGVAIFGISRHRIGVDGDGVTTLVTFHGCPLHCKYCLNPQCHEPEEKFPKYTPERLYEELKVDELYFKATGGGVTFGGGEPCLQSEFIEEFRRLCGPDWKIRVETCLNVRWPNINRLVSIVDEWIVDIKADNSEVYERYTGVRLDQALQNLYWMMGHVPASKILLRIPIIPGYVSEEEARRAKEWLEPRAHNRIEIFEYQLEKPRHEVSEKAGKAKCNLLKEIRRELADKNGIRIPSRECTHKGACPGTCPLCEYENQILLDALQNNKDGVWEVSEELKERINNVVSSDGDQSDILEGDTQILDGDIAVNGNMVPWHEERELLYSGPIAGLGFHVHYDHELWEELSEGEILALVRDRKNKHDSKAVAIALDGDYDGDPNNFDFDFILGYIPRTDNAVIASLLDEGLEDELEVEVTEVRRHGPLNDRIQIAVWRTVDGSELPRPNLLRADSLDSEEMKRMKKELDERGTTYFRWGGFPHHTLQYPIEGEKVILVHQRTFDVELYLMRVLAVDEGCASYLDEPDSWDCIDDCAAFILTNVMGPLHVSINEFHRLKDFNLRGLDATEYLSQEATDFFRNLFKSY